MSLLDDLKAEGLTVETWPNWENHAAPMPGSVSGFRPIGILVHWDAVNGWNPATYFMNPRFDAPTYHIALEQNGTCWLGSQGYVYGAGGGDSAVYRAMRDDNPVPPARIEKDMNGNPFFWSVCVNYMPGWKGQPGPPLPTAQYESLVKSVAALCRREGWDPQFRVNDHDGWTIRKDDLSGSAPGNAWAAPSNWNLQRFRDDVKQQLGDDMVSRDDKVEPLDVLAGDVQRLRDSAVFTEYTSPGKVVITDELAAFLNRHFSKVVLPAIAEANTRQWDKVLAWVRDHVKTSIAAAFAAGAGSTQIDYGELVAEIGRVLSGG